MKLLKTLRWKLIRMLGGVPDEQVKEMGRWARCPDQHPQLVFARRHPNVTIGVMERARNIEKLRLMKRIINAGNGEPK